jgi:hypothetical protein
MFVTFPSPILELQHTPLPPKCCDQGVCPDSLLFRWFQFRLTFESIKELGSVSLLIFSTSSSFFVEFFYLKLKILIWIFIFILWIQKLIFEFGKSFWFSKLIYRFWEFSIEFKNCYLNLKFLIWIPYKNIRIWKFYLNLSFDISILKIVVSIFKNLNME